jgi:hypothetical protein
VFFEHRAYAREHYGNERESEMVSDVATIEVAVAGWSVLF